MVVMAPPAVKSYTGILFSTEGVGTKMGIENLWRHPMGTSFFGDYAEAIGISRTDPNLYDEWVKELAHCKNDEVRAVRNMVADLETTIQELTAPLSLRYPGKEVRFRHVRFHHQ